MDRGRGGHFTGVPGYNLVLGVLHRVPGVLHRVVGVVHRVLVVLHRYKGYHTGYWGWPV